jgi:hypothetical protein
MKTKSSMLNPQPQSRRHFLQFVSLPLLTVLVCAGCGQEQKSSAGVNPVGNYKLVSVDGKNVPCALQHEGHNLTINAGAFTINADKTCSSKMDFIAPNGSKGSRDVKATYTQTGGTLTMKWEGAGMTKGDVNGDTFTMNNEGMILTYRK